MEEENCQAKHRGTSDLVCAFTIVSNLQGCTCELDQNMVCPVHSHPEMDNNNQAQVESAPEGGRLGISLLILH